MNKNKFSRREFLKLLSSLGLATAFGKLLRFFPEAEFALAKSDTRNPLDEISIHKSREVEGEEKKRLLDQAVGSVDGSNVFKGDKSKLNLENAKAVIHTLSDGNLLTAVAVPLADANTIVVYYTFAEPLIVDEPNGGRLSSQAGIYMLNADDQKITLKSLSINGAMINLDTPSMGGRDDPCGGCVSPIYGPWNYYSQNCGSYDGACLVRCCASCVVACASGATPSCLVCIFVWCPVCAMTCCTYWYDACPPCPL